VRVGTGSDEEGMLILDDKPRPMAGLPLLGDHYGDVSGPWYVKAKFGLLDRLDHPTHADLDRAQESIRQHLAREHWAALPPRRVRVAAGQRRSECGCPQNQRLTGPEG
jgi:hypothetical protein